MHRTYARSTYAPDVVLTRIKSPFETKSGTCTMKPVAVLILVGYSATIQVETFKFVACVTCPVKGGPRAKVAQFHAHYRAATTHFDVLPLEHTAKLPFKFNGYTFLQVTCRYH